MLTTFLFQLFSTPLNVLQYGKLHNLLKDVSNGSGFTSGTGSGSVSPSLRLVLLINCIQLNPVVNPSILLFFIIYIIKKY